MQSLSKVGELVWDECGSLRDAGLPQIKLLLPLDPGGLLEGRASPELTSGWCGAPKIGLEVAASEGGAKSQNTWGWRGWEHEAICQWWWRNEDDEWNGMKWTKRWCLWIPELWLEKLWVCPLLCESSSLESSSSSSSTDAQARSLASAMANCSATPKGNTNPKNLCGGFSNVLS